MKHAVWLLFGVSFFVLPSNFASGADQRSDISSDWLNGKWEGRPPAGGELKMDIHVEKDNAIKGTGLIPGKGRGDAAHPQVTGTIRGKVIHLETFFPSSFPQGKVVYNCKPAGQELQCRTPAGYETTFKKMS